MAVQDFEGARSALLQLVGDKVLQLAESNATLLTKAKRLLGRINLLRLAQLGGEVAVTLHTGVPVGAVGRAVLKAGEFLGLGRSEVKHADGEKTKKGKKLKANSTIC
jgi:hypothetical protein